MDFKVSFTDGFAFFGLAATIVLVVLDKAGKLKGPLLLFLLALAILTVVPIAIGNPWVHSPTSSAARFSRRVICLSILGVLYGLLAMWVSESKGELETEAESTNRATSTEKSLPIQISYDPVTTQLPLVIPPYGKYRIMTFTDEKGMDLIWTPPSPVQVAWPRNFRQSKHTYQVIGVITVSNHSTFPVLNLVTAIESEFRQAGPMKTQEELRAILNAPNLGTRYVPLALDSLAPGESLPIFVVNESQYAVVVKIPARCTLELYGESEKRQIAFKKRENTVFDSMIAISAPSLYVWKHDQVVGLRPQ